MIVSCGQVLIQWKDDTEDANENPEGREKVTTGEKKKQGPMSRVPKSVVNKVEEGRNN